MQLSPFASSLDFHDIGVGAVGVRGEGKGGTTVGLDVIMASMNHTYVDILKIDCEGCETTAFEGMEKLDVFRKGGALFGVICVEIHE